MSLTRFIPAFIWFILSIILLCLPGSTIPKYPWLATIHADKIIHIFLFGTLCLLFMRPFRLSGTINRPKMFLLIMLSGIAYGTLMEFVQKYWIPNRSFEILDIVSDSLGCLLAYIYGLKKFSGRV